MRYRTSLALVCVAFLIGLVVPRSTASPPTSHQATRLQKVPVKVVETEVRTKLKLRKVEKVVPSRTIPPVGARLVRYAPGCSLRRGAAASLTFVEEILGRQIQTVSCHRSSAQQAALYAAKPGIAAPPGSSLHEDGRAIDVNMRFLARFPRLRQLLREFGWSQFAPGWEPWHFSYRAVG